MGSFRSKRFGRTHGRRSLRHRAQIQRKLLALRQELGKWRRSSELRQGVETQPIAVAMQEPASDHPSFNAAERKAQIEARNPDEILFPAPFRDPADFAPIPPPQARLADLLELAGHTGFVLLVTVVLPLVLLWAAYRLYRWLPMETMALLVVSAAALWAYRDRLQPLLKRLLFGHEN